MTTSTTGKQPRGLYPLFMTEMWERLGFYLMLGILYLYIIDTERGGLGLSVKQAAEIYGTYMALVYFTPFLGGMIADRFLGFRRSVLIGGVLMAAGYFALGVRTFPTFFTGLALLCIGNGFFKPNISAMVGNLYAPDDPRRDTGFNIFYMGINVGASISALLSAPLRNMWSFNLAFTAAGVGLLIGVVILIVNWRKLADADHPSERSSDDISFKQVMLTIMVPVVLFGVVGYFVGRGIPFINDTLGPITFGFLVAMVPVAVYFGLLVKRASPQEKPGLAALIPVFVAGGAFFMVLHLSGGLMTAFAEKSTDRRAEWIPSGLDFYAQRAMPLYFVNAGPDLPRPDPGTLLTTDPEVAAMFGARIMQQSKLDSLVAAVPDLAVERGDVEEANAFLQVEIYPDDVVRISTETDPHGLPVTTVKTDPDNAEPTAEVLLQRPLAAKEGESGDPTPILLVSETTYGNVYPGGIPGEAVKTLPPGRYVRLVNAEMLTGLLNPVFVVVLTPVVVAFFTWRIRKGKPISTARKIFLGMLITTGAILIMAFGAYLGKDGAIKTSMIWMVLYYMVITVGELCLSPMGLSLVTKLSPKRLVGLMMGGWFLSTAVGNKLSGFISGLEPSAMMFVILAAATAAVALFILALLPKLDRAIKQYGA